MKCNHRWESIGKNYISPEEKNCNVTGSDGKYNLRFNLANMVEDGGIPDTKYGWVCKDCGEISETEHPNYTMNADVLVNQVLFNLSKCSGYGQSLYIKFETKSGWDAYIRLWLYPYIYKDVPNGGEYCFHKNDFHELFLVEKEPIFLKWNEISFSYSDTHLSTLINLEYDKPFTHSRSHYSGHLFVSWWDYVDEEGIIKERVTEKTKCDEYSKTRYVNDEQVVKESLCKRIKHLLNI